MKTNGEIKDNARDAGFKIVEITYGTNGYPKRLGDHAIINFDNFQQAQDFADENGLEVTIFSTKNGWHFWQKHGWVNKPLSADNYISDLGDNYSEAVKDNDYISDRLIELSKNFAGSFDDIEKFISDQKEIKEELEKADTDEIVIIGYGKYYETVKKEMMQYHEDVTTYAVGVFLPKQEEIEEDEE